MPIILVNLFIEDKEDIDIPKARPIYGILCGASGWGMLRDIGGLIYFCAGSCAAKETLYPLFVRPPEPESVRQVQKTVLSYQNGMRHPRPACFRAS